MYKGNLTKLLSIVNSFLIIMLIVVVWTNYTKDRPVTTTITDPSSPSDYNINLNDTSGASHIHVNTTPQGDLWVYNSYDKTVTYIKKPENNTDRIDVIEEKLPIAQP